MKPKTIQIISIKVDFLPKYLPESTFMFIFAAEFRTGTVMKTNKKMDDIRSTISPEMKLQMELSVAIANRIYEILEARGLSQKDFAKLMGKTETEVSRWLSGTHNMTLSTLCKIAAALNAEVVKVADYELEPSIA